MTAGGDLRQVAASVERFPDQAVRRACDLIRRAALDQARLDTGGDMRLSGANARLTVSVVVRGMVAVLGQVTAGPRRAAGPWRWLDDGTRPRAQGRGQHPGTTAKHTWTAPTGRAILTAERRLMADWDAVVR